MSKEFVVKKNTDYLKSYFKSMAIVIPAILFGISNIFKQDFPYKKEALILCAAVVVIVVMLSVKKYFNEKDKRYIVGDHGIQIIKNNQIENYEFFRLQRIKIPSVKQKKQTGFDTLILDFNDGKKIKLDSRIPFYHEFREYLKDTLKREGYYDRIAIDNEL